MLVKYAIPLLALIGALFAVRTVVAGYQEPPVPPPVAEPPRAPFATYIASAGIVEPSTENIDVSAAVPGLVTEVAVHVGDLVAAGTVLFRQDARDVEAQRAVEEAGLASARAELARQQALPRAEDLRAAEARTLAAESDVGTARLKLELAESLEDPGAISREERAGRTSAVRVAEARLAESKADLDLVRNGAWEPDLETARAAVAQAEARVHALDVALERLIVRAPCSATVLQVDVRAGEFAPAGVLTRPLLILGDTSVLHVRADIDENEVWRYAPGAKAIAYVQGNRDIESAMEFVRVEPFVVPKVSLTGSSSERVDTRVLQVIYSFDPTRFPVYVGQQVDVYFEARRGAAR